MNDDTADADLDNSISHIPRSRPAHIRGSEDLHE